MPAVAVHHTETSDASWDGPMHRTRCKTDQSAGYYKKIFAWRDPDSEESQKTSWRFIHHFVSEEGDPGLASTVACSTGIGVLNGARGGTTIPDTDREGVHRHLAAHLKDAGLDAPELKKELTMETKDFPMEIKALEDDGTFEGWLSVYDVIDYGGDSVEHGAFTKTLQETAGKIPLLWQHKTDSPIGAAILEDADEGLKAKGHLNLDVEQARTVHSMMKFLKKFGLRMGLSIGFLPVKDAMDKGVRLLKEIKLFEGSVVTLPMNRFALVTDVKALKPGEIKDFSEQLESIQTWALHYQLLNALSYALEEEIGYYAEGDKAARLANLQTTLSQFVTAYLDYAPRLLDVMGVKTGSPLEHKDILPNAANQATLAAFAKSILALCPNQTGTPQGAAAVEGKAAAVSTEPVGDHSEAIQIPAW